MRARRPNLRHRLKDAHAVSAYCTSWHATTEPRIPHSRLISASCAISRTASEVGGELRAINEQFVAWPVGGAHMKGQARAFQRTPV